jgi:23S rRNA pseudouridine1911/1915/1917 synthase
MNEQFRIVAADGGKRLDVFLAEQLSIPRSKVKRMVDEGCVTADGRIPKASALIKPTMVIEGRIPPEEPLEAAPEAIPLDILYEDEHLLAINKEAGMVVHPACGHHSGTLVNAVLAHLEGKREMRNTEHGTEGAEAGSQETNSEIRDSRFEIRNASSELLNPESAAEDRAVPDSRFAIRDSQLSSLRPGIVHRLDKGTTGVIVIAKDAQTQEHLAALFKGRFIEKTYRAIVEGYVRGSGGTIEGNIGRHPIERKKMAVLSGRGREAVTAFAVLQHLKGFTIVEAYPKTGRTHQIRVHLSHIGHPVVGDLSYGKKARTMAERPLLHAYRITFPRPGTGEALTIEAPVPRDMQEFAESHAL